MRKRYDALNRGLFISSTVDEGDEWVEDRMVLIDMDRINVSVCEESDCPA